MSRKDFDFYDPRKEAEKLNKDIRKQAKELRKSCFIDELENKPRRETKPKTCSPRKSVPRKRIPSRTHTKYNYEESGLFSKTFGGIDDNFTGYAFTFLFVAALIYIFVIEPIYSFITSSPVGFFVICLFLALFSIPVIYIYKVFNKSEEIIYIPTKESTEISEEPIYESKELDIIISFIESEVKLRYGKNKIEKDYQQDLEQAFMILKERYGYEVVYESVHNNHRIDFLINNSIGVELKVHRGGSTVKRELFSQITEYAEYCDKIIGVVINITTDDINTIKDVILTQLSYQNRISPENYNIVVINASS